MKFKVILITVFLFGIIILSCWGNEINESDIPLTTGFDYPVGDKNSGWPYPITQKFQDESANKYASGHLGIDWGTNIGGDHRRKLRAVSNGIVIFQEDLGGGWGKVLIIAHRLTNNEIIYSQYAHLSEFGVKVGQIVRRSDFVGKTGDCGTGPHLHFEMKKISEIGGGYSTNPEYVKLHFNPIKFIQENRNIAFKFQNKRFWKKKYDCIYEIKLTHEVNLKTINRGITISPPIENIKIWGDKNFVYIKFSRFQKVNSILTINSNLKNKNGQNFKGSFQIKIEQKSIWEEKIDLTKDIIARVKRAIKKIFRRLLGLLFFI